MHILVKDLNTTLDTQWTKSSTELGKVTEIDPIKVQIGPTKLLHKLPQYSLKPEAKKVLKPIVGGPTLQGLLRLCTILCNSPVLTGNKPNG